MSNIVNKSVIRIEVVKPVWAIVCSAQNPTMVIIIRMVIIRKSWIIVIIKLKGFTYFAQNQLYMVLLMRITIITGSRVCLYCIFFL